MEHKIGEIFQYKGEWYQCMEGTGCYKCDFNIDENTCIADNPHCTCRSDKKDVIFKKLEKVGESFSKYVFPRGNVLVQRYKLHIPCDTNVSNGYWIYHWDEKLVDIEIKQNKEDMEEKKQKLDKLVEDYSYNRIPYEIFDNCLKQLYVDKQIGENNPSLKEFDLEAAKAGKPVCTRDGRKARIICFDAKTEDKKSIIALVPSRYYPGFEDLITYPNNGNYHGGHKNDGDLMMLPEKRSGWAKIRKDINLYNTKEEADRKMIGNDDYVTAKVFWEE